MALSFEVNQGQAAPQVQFLAHGAGYELFLSGSVMTLALSAAQPSPATPSATGIGAAPPAPDLLQMQFLGANPDVQAVGVDPLPGTVNYLIGDNPALWHTDIPTYAGVELEDLYPGISLRYYSNAGQLEYDWVVSPGADPGDIRLAFQGDDGVTIDPQGDLVLNTPDGAVAEHAPTIYQTIGGVQQSVAGSYVTQPDGSIGLSVGAYDRSQPLTIDPVLTYSTYLGGSGADEGLGIAADAAGDAYVTGYTLSASGSSFEAYVTKLSPDGSTVLYSTYLGGSGITVGTGIAVDGSDSAYVTGYTTEANFPLKNPEQSSNGGGTDAFVTKLSPAGNGLVYSTYLGGSGSDEAFGIALDSSGDAFVAGVTSSKNFPTKNPLPKSGPKGSSDAFVAELNSAGSKLVYSTYLGGSLGDAATAIAVDSTGAAYVTGYTSSIDFPTMDPYQPTNGGSVDAFVSKLTYSASAGLELAYSTYLGGSGTDVGEGIAVDSDGQAYVTGYTSSANFPRENAIEGTFQGNPVDDTDAFVARLSPSGSSLEYSTFLGGAGDNYGRGIAVDSVGNAYVIGQTDSPSFPLASPIQSSLSGPSDVFVTQVNPSGSAFVFSTYLGGTQDDIGTAIAVDATSTIYGTGYTYSTNFPTTPGALQQTLSGTTDAVVFKIPGLTADGVPVFATEGLPFTGVVASFTDRLTGAGDYSAIITWGDGHSSPGTIVPVGSAFEVVGTNTYMEEGAYPVSVQITAIDGRSTVADTTAFVADAPLYSQGVDISGMEGIPITATTVATFTDANPYGTVDDYSATIDWGDDETSTGTIQDDGDGTFAVLGDHTYVTSGSFPLQVTIRDVGGSETVADATATISAWGLQAQERVSDPVQGYLLPLGEATVDLNTGGLSVNESLDFDQSPGTSVGLDPALVYNSTTLTQPIIDGVFSGDPGSPGPIQIQAQLTWGSDTPQPWEEVDTSPQSGDTYPFAIQVDQPVATGSYPWQIKVQATLPDGTVIDRTTTGTAVVVGEGAGDPYGDGWGLSSVDQLVVDPTTQDVLLVDGSGDAELFTYNADGSYTSPPDDFGTLTGSSTTGFIYTAKDQTRWNFDAQGQQTSIVDPDGQQWVYQYNSSGDLDQVNTPDGGVTTLIYSGGLLASIQEPGGRQLTFSHSGDDLTGLVDEDGNSRTFTYDDDHHLTGDQWAPLDASFAYDADGLVSQVDLGEGTVYQITSVDAQGLQGQPGVATVTDGLGHTTSYALDAEGHLTELVQPDGTSETQQFDAHGQVVSSTDFDGNTTTYRYAYGPGDGDLLEIIYADGSTEQYRYDPTFHEVTFEEDPDGGITTQVIDPNTGDVLQVVDPDQDKTTYVWSNGLLMSTTDPRGLTTTYAYDSDRRLIMTEDPDGNIEETTYDAAGNVATETEIPGPQTGGPTRVTQFVYDARDQLVSETDPALDTTTYQYDAYGDVVATTDGRGIVTMDVYDQRGLEVSETEAYGTTEARTTTYDYDAAENLIETIDPRQEPTIDTYDQDDRLIATIEPAGDTTHYTLDPDGNVIKTVDGDGDVVVDTYDSMDRLLTETDYDSNGVTVVSSTSDTYDGDGNLLTQTDGDGNVTTDTYDGDGNLLSTTVREANGKLVSESGATYDQDGNVLTQTDGDGNVASYSYDGDGNVLSTTVRGANGNIVSSTSDTYDVEGNVLTQTDGDGNVTTNTYDGDGDVLSTSITDANGKLISESGATYDKDGNVLTQTDGDGNVTTNTYDDEGDVLSTTIADKNGNVVSMTSDTYDDDGELLTETDGDGNVTSYTYDGAGNVLSTTITDKNGNVVGTVSDTYDGDGNILTETDGDGNVTTDTYDGDGDVLSSTTTDANGKVVSESGETYDEDGNVLTETDGDGNVTSYTYDGAGDVLSTTITNASGKVVSESSATYDEDGNVLTETDGDGNVTSYTYDGAGDVLSTTITDAGGHLISESSATYDKDGNVLTETDGDGDVTENTYDGDRLISTTAGYGTAAASTTSYTYDEDGNVLTETDGDGNVTSYTYDGAGDVTSTTVRDKDGDLVGRTSSTYDLDGNLLSTTDADGRTETFEYDADRTTDETWYNANGSIANQLSYTYDGDGNILSASDDAGTDTMTYDGDRLISSTDPSGLTLSYTYDGDGNVTSIRDSQGGVTTLSYNGNGQVTAETYQDATTQLRVDLTYDLAGNVVEETRYNDLAGTQLAGTTQYRYDGDELTSIVQKDAGGDLLGSFSYAYDPAGRLSSQIVDGVLTNYAYDATGQLIQAGSQTYTYDADGNPTGPGTTIGPDNELLSDGTWDDTYDAAGNLIGKTAADGSGITWAYGYDDADQLTSAVEEDTSGTVLTQATYTYDAIGDRIGETVTTGGVTTTQEFAYEASGTLYADLDGSGQVQTRYVAGVGGPDQWLARVDATGGAWLLSDHEGSVTTVVARDGSTALDQIGYDAFGNITSETDPSQGGRLKFQGGELDAVTGTYHFGARDYDPTARRWTSQDPIGFAGGDENLYRYVDNGPTYNIDPDGLWTWQLDAKGRLIADSEANDTLNGLIQQGYDKAKLLALPEAAKIANADQKLAAGVMIDVTGFLTKLAQQALSRQQNLDFELVRGFVEREGTTGIGKGKTVGTSGIDVMKGPEETEKGTTTGAYNGYPFGWGNCYGFVGVCLGEKPPDGVGPENLSLSCMKGEKFGTNGKEGFEKPGDSLVDWGKGNGGVQCWRTPKGGLLDFFTMGRKETDKPSFGAIALFKLDDGLGFRHGALVLGRSQKGEVYIVQKLNQCQTYAVSKANHPTLEGFGKPTYYQ
jgi:RHS repeat-associated protein